MKTLRSLFGLSGVSVFLFAACGPSAPPSGVLRLVDLFSETNVLDASATASPDEASPWRFKNPSQPFTAGPGIRAASSSGSTFVGRATTKTPIVYAEREGTIDDDDLLQEIVIRARVSSGANLSVSFESDEKLDLDRIVSRVERFPWQLTTPLVLGDDFQTYTIRASAAARASIPASAIRYLLLRPTDEAGAEFEIESVQLVFRKQYLARIPAGVSWQGLSEVYRETIVARSPEQTRFELSLPAHPMLDLAMGTVEDSPVTFSVAVSTSGGEERVLLHRTLSTPNRWEEATVDLSDLALRDVVLSLRLESDAPGALGFWGAPAVRERGVPSRLADDGLGIAPKGVVVILLDTLRRDHLPMYGYARETSPALAKLSAEGTLFRDAIAQGAWTKVSAPSILSSTYPTSNGISEMGDKLPASADTLAESFRAAGYATWGGSANGFTGRANNLHQGFEILHERGSLVLPDGQSRSKTARSLADPLLSWLETHKDIPFFVFFHPIDPHSPYEPYRPYDTLWTEPGKAKWFEESREKVQKIVDKKERNGRLPFREDIVEAGVDPDEYNAYELAWYDGSIRAADVEIGRVLAKLDELGLTESTLVVFLSDHGEEFRDHGGGFHEDTVYGEIVNVPLVLRWPPVVESGRLVDDTVEMLDLAPTVLELTGIPVPERMQGESLVPLLLPQDGRRWASRPAVSEWKRRVDLLEKGGVDAFGIIADGYKLVHNVSRPEGYPEYELYDHKQDPLDQHDLAESHPEIVERLSQQLERWHAWALEKKLPTDAEATEGIDAEELERLRSLGYVQ